MRRLLSLPFRLLRNILRGLMLRTVADMRGGKKQRYAKEALLRDIHEYTAVKAYLVGAVFLFVASEMALLIPAIAWTGSAIFLYRAWVRGCHGYYVASYQRNLLRLPLYRMESRALRQLKNQFVGMGFQWKSIHAQRLYDIELHKNERFTRFSGSYDRARDYCSRQHHGLFARALARYLDSDSLLNPWRPAPKLEGKAYLHTVGMPEGEQPIYQPLPTRVSHTIVFGTTRVGKTRLAEVLITQDIHRGDIVIVFDPKGDRELLLRMYLEAKAAGREDQFYMFHLGFPEFSAQYNPVGSFLRVTEVATRIANQMPGEGQSAAFREFVWAFVNQIAKGMVLLGRTPSYPLLKQYSADVEPLFIDVMELLYQRHHYDYRKRLAEFEAALLMSAEDRRKAGFNFTIPRAMNDRSQRGKAFWLLYREVGDKLPLTMTERDVAMSMMKAFQTDASYMAKLVASLDPFLEKMTTGAVSRLIAPDFSDPTRDVFSWTQIIQARGIVYIGLDALSDAEVAATVGNSMFADLTSVAGRLYKHGADHGLPAYSKSGYQPKICLHADEFNELAGPEFVPMLNKAGGAGVQVTAYTQTLPDIEARVGSKSKAEQMLGNFNTVVMLRVLNESTAKLLIEKTNKVNVSDIATFSGSSDNPDLTSRVRFRATVQSREVSQSVELLRTSDLSKLPKGQAFALLDGNNLYKLRIPLLQYDAREAVPNDIAAVARAMEKNYSNSPTNTDWARYQEYLREDDIFADGTYSSMQDLCNNYLRELDSDTFMQGQAALMEAE